MAAKSLNLQDSFLNQARKENINVTIYMVNGFQIKGQVRGFDSFTIVLESFGKQQIIYKHAVSTITPARPMSNLIDFGKLEAIKKQEPQSSEKKPTPK